MEPLVQVKFVRAFGAGTPHVCDANGRVLLGSHQQRLYACGEVAGFRADIARAIVKAGYATVVERERP